MDTNSPPEAKKKGYLCGERTRGRNGGPRSNRDGGEEGGEERSFVAHGDREGLLMDGPWLLIRSDLWWVRTFPSGKCWSGPSDCQERFCSGSPEEEALPSSWVPGGSNEGSLSQDKLAAISLGEASRGQKVRREDAKWGI